ncbi:hypothetical protein G9A89_023039 [Geosiphon pyriformis]|nr:hypothetical protein G9A89_023039 [Geosiphon pyriformis]
MGKCYSKDKLTRIDDTHPKYSNPTTPHTTQISNSPSQNFTSAFPQTPQHRSRLQPRRSTSSTHSRHDTRSLHQGIGSPNYEVSSLGGAGAYLIPVSDEEIDRLQMQHYLFRYLWHGNYSAPVENWLKLGGAQVLDVGCGPGSWILEMATTYQLSHFTGVDISPIFPNDIKPRNVTFKEGDITRGLDFPDNTFDFVNMRSLGMVFTERQWEEIVLPELVRVTKPGGWIELMEEEGILENQGIMTAQLQECYHHFINSIGIYTNFMSQKLPRYMQSTNQFKKIYHKETQVPLGKWNGKFGELAIKDFEWKYHHIRHHLVPFSNITNEEYDRILQNTIQEVEEYKTFATSFRFFGQKIGDATQAEMNRSDKDLLMGIKLNEKLDLKEINRELSNFRDKIIDGSMMNFNV